MKKLRHNPNRKASNISKHGGAGRGQGNKPPYGATQEKRVLFLDDETYAFFEALAGNHPRTGNPITQAKAAAGMRRLYQLLKQSGRMTFSPRGPRIELVDGTVVLRE